MVVQCTWPLLLLIPVHLTHLYISYNWDPRSCFYLLWKDFVSSGVAHILCFELAVVAIDAPGRITLRLYEEDHSISQNVGRRKSFRWVWMQLGILRGSNIDIFQLQNVYIAWMENPLIGSSKFSYSWHITSNESPTNHGLLVRERKYFEWTFLNYEYFYHHPSFITNISSLTQPSSPS